MAIFKRDKLIDISKRNDSGALVKRLESEIKELDREVSVLESELGQQVIENDKLKQKLNDSKNGLITDAGFSEEFEENQRELERLSSLIDQYELQIEHLQAEQTNHVALTSSETDGELGQLKEENQQLRKEIDLILTQTVDQQEKQIGILQEKLASLTTDETADQGQVDSLTAQLAQQEKALQETQDLLEIKEAKLAALESEAQQLLQTKKVLEQAANDDLTKIDSLTEALQALQEREHDLQRMLSERDSQNQDYEALQTDYADLQNQINDLTQALADKISELAEARQTIESHDKQLVACDEAHAQELATLQSLLDVKLTENEESRLQYQKELQEKNAELSEIKQRHTLAVQRNDELVNNIQELESAIGDKSKVIDDLTQKMTQLTESYTDKNIALQSQLASLQQQLDDTNSKTECQLAEVERIKSVYTQKESELLTVQSDMLLHQETLTSRISELETIQTELSEKNTSLSMRLTTVTQKLYEEQSKTLQLQSDLSELRLQHQTVMIEKQTLLSEKEQAVTAEKSEIATLKQELTAMQLTNQKLYETNHLAQTKIEDEKTMAEQKVERLLNELSDANDAKQHQVMLLQSIISENKTMVNQLGQQVEELKLENQRLTEEKKHKVQELQVSTQEFYQKLSEVNEKNRVLEAELLAKDESNQQELSEMMLMINRLKHEVIEEANLEIERRRDEMKEEERSFKKELHQEASRLLNEVSDFKTKFIESVSVDDA